MLKPLSPLTTEEVISNPRFRGMMACMVEDLSDALDARLAMEMDTFGLPEGIEGTAPEYVKLRNVMLQQLTSFILRKPIAATEVVDSRDLNYHAGTLYFKGHFSAADECNEAEYLRKQNEALQAQIRQLQREKAESEQSFVAALRKKPTRRFDQRHASFEDYISAVLKNAVADGIREVTGYV